MGTRNDLERFALDGLAVDEVPAALDDVGSFLYDEFARHSVFSGTVWDLAVRNGWEVVVIPPPSPTVFDVLVDELMSRLVGVRLWIVKIADNDEIEAVQGIDVPQAA